MTDKREELIEEAAKALHEATYGDGSWEHREQMEDDLYRRRAEAVLAVFEQAQRLDYYDPRRQDSIAEHDCTFEDGEWWFGHGMPCKYPVLHATQSDAEQAHTPTIDGQFLEGVRAAQRTPCIRSVPGSVIPCCDTPTDDEREARDALGEDIQAYLVTDGVYLDHAVTRSLAQCLLADDEWIIRRTVQGEPTDPNKIPDAVADAAQVAFHEFAWGDEPIGRLSVARQGWKVAIAAALDATQEGDNHG